MSIVKRGQSIGQAAAAAAATTATAAIEKGFHFIGSKPRCGPLKQIFQAKLI